MSLELTWKRWVALGPWVRTAVLVWVLMTVVLCTRSALMPHKQSVYPIWKTAGHDWLTGHDLYEECGDRHRVGFRYGPLVAGAFTVCDLLPERLGNVLWRLLGLGAFLFAVTWWLRSALPLSLGAKQQAVFFLLLAPLALGTLNNGQANLLLVALMLLTVTGAVVGRWSLAAGCIALAVTFKVYPIALALLLAVAYPKRFPVRFLVALAILAALPFLMQHPEYVLRQYRLWWERLRTGDAHRRYWPLRDAYRDVWMLIRAWKLPVSLFAYTILQLAGAAVCGLLTLLVCLRRWADKDLCLVALSLATGWMLVLGPSPESCTFVLVGPALIGWIFQTHLEHRPFSHYLTVQGWGLLAGCVIAGTGPIGIGLYHAAGLQPLGVLLYAGSFLAVLVQRLLAPAERIGPPASFEAPASRAARGAA
jgi:hypothetical protein